MFIKLLIVVCLIECFNSCRFEHKSSKFISKRRQLIEKRLKSTMEEKRVVPDVIDTVPKDLIKIQYPNSGVEVNLGNELTPLSVKDEPVVNWPIEEEQYYTLVMTDPDASAGAAPIKHWLVMNIPGTDVKSGDTLAGYRGSGAPKGTGLHRYIFLVYKQTGRLTHSETVVNKDTREGRQNFIVKHLAQKYGLGEPIAGNFFLAQYDDYVGQMRAQRAQTR